MRHFSNLSKNYITRALDTPPGVTAALARTRRPISCTVTYPMSPTVAPPALPRTALHHDCLARDRLEILPKADDAWDHIVGEPEIEE